MAKQSYSLYELNEYIKRVMALNFSEPIWINCEISQINEVRGNYYLELVEHDDNNTTKAQVSAAIWYKNFLFIKNKLGPLANSLLTAGSHVQLKVQVEFNERYGLKLVIEDIDPSYTLGKLEMARQQIIERLETEGVTQLNKQVPIPRVLQRIAIISSETAAGFKDFYNQCEHNSYGYFFSLTLFQSAMQGQNTEREVCAAMDLIKSRATEFDAIVIIRGGGSKLDLSFFDNFNIGYKIATSTLPVITGIGHEIDNTVADIVAGVSLKTPTAVADYLIEKIAHFESSIFDTSNRISQNVKRILNQEELSLQFLLQSIFQVPKQITNQQTNAIDYVLKSIQTAVKNRFIIHSANLNSFDSIINANDPQAILKKGYAVIMQNDKLISSKKQLKKGEFEITFADGNVKGTTI